VSAALARPASAQYLQENGRALDANPRAGSGGRNDTGAGVAPGRGPLVTGNQIVTGNVTAGRQFRDFVGYTDPAAFRGPTAGLVGDRFVRGSAGVPQPMGGPQINLSQPTAFYGSDRVGPPPAGYVPTVGASGGYIPSSAAAVNPGLGVRTFNQGLDSSFRSGELTLPTLDSATNQPTLLTASPLYGVRVWQAGVNPNDFLAPGVPRDAAGRPDLFGQPGQFPNASDRFRIDANSVLRMREELNRAGEQGQQDSGQGGLVQPLSNQALGGNGGVGVGANAAGGNAQQAGSSGASGGPNGALTSTALASDLRSNAIGGGGGTTASQGTRYRLLVSPEKQTPQLAELRRRFERQHGEGPAVGGVEANREFNLERAAQQPRPGAGAPQPGGANGVGALGGGPVGGVAGGGKGAAPAPRSPSPAPTPTVPTPGETVVPTPPAQPGSNPNAVTAPAAPAEPVQIKSLAADVQAKGLRDLLTSAEDLMRQEKYAAALDKYNAASEVAPNNPLITVGRAHAELAASYYRRAETDLRDALAAAPHLVQAQFDLKTLVGPDRLQIVVKDLKELAAADPQQARPLLLLAYIAYNTGNADQAATYLEQAEKRAQGDDTLLKAWRQNWKLPKGGSGDASDANK
jgi:hypothetical protein